MTINKNTCMLKKAAMVSLLDVGNSYCNYEKEPVDKEVIDIKMSHISWLSVGLNEKIKQFIIIYECILF